MVWDKRGRSGSLRPNYVLLTCTDSDSGLEHRLFLKQTTREKGYRKFICTLISIAGHKIIYSLKVTVNS